MAKFKDVITHFSDTLGWGVEEILDDCATFNLSSESGNEQTLFVTLNEEVIEFDIPSAAVYNSEDEISHELSTDLLKRNAELPVGAWVLEQIDDQWCYSIMWNTSLDELEGMDEETLSEVVNTLVEECDEFDQTWQVEEGE